MTRKVRFGTLAAGALGALSLVACSTVKSATGMAPDTSARIEPSRLSGLSTAQLTEVNARRDALDQSRRTEQMASREAEDIAAKLKQAKSGHELAKAELKTARQRAETATREVPAGEEQRAAQEAELDPGTAEALEQNAERRVEYLEKLKGYVDARRRVSQELVSWQQARVDVASYEALERAKPKEARDLNINPRALTATMNDRQNSVANARTEMEKKRGEALVRYDSWWRGYNTLPEQRRGEVAPKVDDFKPL